MYASLLLSELQSRVTNIAAVSAISDIPAAKPDPILRPTRPYSWVINSDAKEHDLVVCGKGDAIRFYWESGTHDMVHMANEANYVGCDFSSTAGVVTLAGVDAGSYLFECDTFGKHLLSCSVDKEDAEAAHCAVWNQKVQAQVVDYTHT
jgi:hypothetical protein